MPLLVSVLALVAIACSGGGSDVVKIGLLSPQTGPIAQYAPGFEDAAKIAIAELNEANSDFQFELIVADSNE